MSGSLKAGLVFALVGPVIGSAPWAIGVFVAEGDGSMIWPLVLVFGFVFGFGPAVVAAVAFLARVRMHVRAGDAVASRARLALWGATSGFLSAFLLNLPFGTPSSATVFALQGALAGAVCGALCQPLLRPRNAPPATAAAPGPHCQANA